MIPRQLLQLLFVYNFIFALNILNLIQIQRLNTDDVLMNRVLKLIYYLPIFNTLFTSTYSVLRPSLYTLLLSSLNMSEVFPVSLRFCFCFPMNIGGPPPTLELNITALSYQLSAHAFRLLWAIFCILFSTYLFIYESKQRGL